MRGRVEVDRATRLGQPHPYAVPAQKLGDLLELMALAGSAQRCLSKLLSSGRGEAARVGGAGQALGPLTRRGCWSSVDHVPPDITR